MREFVERNAHHPLSEWPPRRWDLDTLTLAALYFHPSLEVARAEWAVAAAGERTAGARPNPTIGLTPEHAFNPGSGVSPWLFTLDLDIPIETAGKRARRIEQAEQLSEAARFKVASAAWRVRAEVRSALLDHVQAGRRAALIGEQVATQETLLSRLEQQAGEGAIAGADTVAARIELERSRADLRAAERLSSVSAARIAGAVGLPASALASASFDYDTSLPSIDEETARRMQREALQGRPDVMAALAAYAASDAQLQLEIARQYPDVHLGTGYQYDQGDNKWSLGVHLELPLLNRNEGPIAEAEAKRSQAAAEFLATQAGVLAEIEQARADASAAAAEVEQLAPLLAAQRRRVASVEAQIIAGAAEPVDLLVAKAELKTSELAALNARMDAARAFGQLEDAVEQPLDLDPGAVALGNP